MARKASGYSLSRSDIPTLLGMVARDDRDHDIAAWFGVNQGRIAEAKEGKWGLPEPVPAAELPPKGAPGIKGRRLRKSASQITALLDKGDIDAAKAALKDAITLYDKNEA